MHAYIDGYIHTYIHTYLHTYIHTYIIRTYTQVTHTYVHTYIYTYIQPKYTHKLLSVLDLVELEEQLSGASDARMKMIVTDGVFSMDGDICQLP